MIITKLFDSEKYTTLKQNFKSTKFITGINNDKMIIETDDTSLMDYINSNFSEHTTLEDKIAELQTRIEALENK